MVAEPVKRQHIVDEARSTRDSSGLLILDEASGSPGPLRFHIVLGGIRIDAAHRRTTSWNPTPLVSDGTNQKELPDK